MKKGTLFAYKVEDGIYINMTNRCTNSCSFCIRNNGDGAYGTDSLWLEYEPSAEEILSAIAALYSDDATEFVFCGYGEPTVRLSDMIFVAKELKALYPKMPIRVNTNGHADLLCGYDTSVEFGVFDKVSISLNAPNDEKYEELCHSKFRGRAFAGMLKFAENVNKRYKNVTFSVVKEMLTEDELEKCFDISERLSIPLRVRDYISE